MRGLVLLLRQPFGMLLQGLDKSMEGFPGMRDVNALPPPGKGPIILQGSFQTAKLVVQEPFGPPYEDIGENAVLINPQRLGQGFQVEDRLAFVVCTENVSENMVSPSGHGQEDHVGADIGVMQRQLGSTFQMGQALKKGANASQTFVQGKAIGFLLGQVFQTFLFGLLFPMFPCG